MSLLSGILLLLKSFHHGQQYKGVEPTLDSFSDAEKLAKKQKGIDSASKALQFLRATQIVWHNFVSKVLLTCLFDGWTTQIKFIDDGVWKIDPFRPVVRNNGHENNLLIVT